MLTETRLLRPVAMAIATKDQLCVKEFFQIRKGLHVYDSFCNRFDLDAPVQAAPGRLYVASLLKLNADDQEIQKELPEECLSTLKDIAGFIEAQWNGKSGLLLSNGYANIFYVLGKNGQIFVMNVSWISDDRGWNVGDWEFGVNGRWFAGFQIICPGNAEL